MSTIFKPAEIQGIDLFCGDLRDAGQFVAPQRVALVRAASRDQAMHALQGAPTGRTLRPVAAVTPKQEAAIREALEAVVPKRQLRKAA